MALTLGTGPFGAARGSFDFAVPDRVRYWEPWPRRMRAELAGVTVLDSERGVALHETGRLLTHYFPLDDIDLGRLRLSETVSECPYKGDGQHWHLSVGSVDVPDAAWSLPHPLPEAIAAAEHICFYPDKVEIDVDGARVTA